MPFKQHFIWEFKVTNSNQASYVRFSCARSIFVLRWLLARTSLSLIWEFVQATKQTLQMKIPVEQYNCNLKKKLIWLCSTSRPPTLFGIQYDNLQGNRMKEKFWNFQKLSPPPSCTFYLMKLPSLLDLFAIQQPICIPSNESKQTG